jgi:hypothetical protein
MKCPLVQRTNGSWYHLLVRCRTRLALIAVGLVVGHPLDALSGVDRHGSRATFGPSCRAARTIPRSLRVVSALLFCGHRREGRECSTAVGRGREGVAVRGGRAWPPRGREGVARPRTERAGAAAQTAASAFGDDGRTRPAPGEDPACRDIAPDEPRLVRRWRTGGQRPPPIAAMSRESGSRTPLDSARRVLDFGPSSAPPRPARPSRHRPTARWPGPATLQASGCSSAPQHRRRRSCSSTRRGAAAAGRGLQARPYRPLAPEMNILRAQGRRGRPRGAGTPRASSRQGLRPG